MKNLNNNKLDNLLITGAGGFLGWNVCRAALGKWNIHGTWFFRRKKIPGVNAVMCDLQNYKDIKQLFSDVNPDAVIHTAALSDPNFCQNNKALSLRVNVEASVNIAGLCSDRKIPFVYTSSDLVFDGLNPPYKETDNVCPVSIYGEHKAMAENLIMKIYQGAAICRLPLMFGLSDTNNKKSIMPMLAIIKKGDPIHMFTDEFRTPVSAETAAKGLFLAMQKVKGLIHLGGIERISRFEFAKLAARISGIEKPNIIPCLQADLNMAAPRSPDVSLDSSRALLTGYKSVSLIEELKKIKRQIRARLKIN